MGCGGSVSNFFEDIGDTFQDTVIDPVKDVFQTIDDKILEPIYDPIKEVIDPILPEWFKEAPEVIKERLMDPQHLLRHPAELWRVPRDLFEEAFDPLLPEKAKDFMHKPGRTLAAAWVPESKGGVAIIEGIMGVIGVILAPMTGGASLWISRLAAAGFGMLAGSEAVPEGASFGESILPVGFGGLQGYGMAQIGAGITNGVMAVSNGGNFVEGFTGGYKNYAENVAPGQGLPTEISPELAKGLGEVGTTLEPISAAGGDLSVASNLTVNGMPISSFAPTEAMKAALPQYIDGVMNGTLNATGASATGQGTGMLATLYEDIGNIARTASSVSNATSAVTGEQQPEWMSYVNMVGMVGPTVAAAQNAGKNIYEFFSPQQAQSIASSSNFVNTLGSTQPQPSPNLQVGGQMPLITGGYDAGLYGGYNTYNPYSSGGGIFSNIPSTSVPGTQGFPTGGVTNVGGNSQLLYPYPAGYNPNYNISQIPLGGNNLSVSGQTPTSWADILGTINQTANTVSGLAGAYNAVTGQYEPQATQQPGTWVPGQVSYPTSGAYGGATYGAYAPSNAYNPTIYNQNIQYPQNYENIIESLFPSPGASSSTPFSGMSSNMDITQLLAQLLGGGGGNQPPTPTGTNNQDLTSAFTGGGLDSIQGILQLLGLGGGGSGLNLGGATTGGITGLIQSITGNPTTNKLLDVLLQGIGAYQTGKQAEEQRDWYTQMYEPQRSAAVTQAELLGNVYKPYLESQYGEYTDLFKPATAQLGNMLGQELGSPEFSLTDKVEGDIWWKNKERVSNEYNKQTQEASERFAGAGTLGQGPAQQYFSDLGLQKIKSLEDLAVDQSIWEYGQKYAEKQAKQTNMMNFLGRAPQISNPYSMGTQQMKYPEQTIDWAKILGDLTNKQSSVFATP